MEEKDYVVVIGAANIDIGGTPYKPLIPGDSNPGVIKMSYGGVGCNIAHNLALLGVKVELITAIGDDTLGREMLERCESIGMDTSLSLIIPDASSSTYLFINDDDGEMSLALSHVDIVKHITPEYIESLSDVINSAAIVIADCNLTQETLLKIKSVCKVPLYIDTVSVSHADKIKGHLDGIDTLKPNLLEAEFLTDMIIENEYDCLEAAHALIEQGVRRVFISLGPNGMIAADKDHTLKADRYPAEVKCTTGAGDSAMAAIIWSSMKEGEDELEFPVKAANAAASATISVDPTIHPAMSSDMIIRMLDEHNVNIKEVKYMK